MRYIIFCLSHVNPKPLWSVMYSPWPSLCLTCFWGLSYFSWSLQVYHFQWYSQVCNQTYYAWSPVSQLCWMGVLSFLFSNLSVHNILLLLFSSYLSLCVICINEVTSYYKWRRIVLTCIHVRTWGTTQCFLNQ